MSEQLPQWRGLFSDSLTLNKLRVDFILLLVGMDFKYKAVDTTLHCKDTYLPQIPLSNVYIYSHKALLREHK